MSNPTNTEKEYDIQWRQQHDIQLLELDYEKLIPRNIGLTNYQKKLIDYRIQGTLFIGQDFYALVVVSMRDRDPKILINPCPSRIYLINMSQNQVADYIEYEGGCFNFNGRILDFHTINVYKIDKIRVSEYTIYGITNSGKINKLREFKLPTDTKYILLDNTFIYIDQQNILGGFKYNPDNDTQIDLPPIMINYLIPDLNAKLCPLLINLLSDTNKYLIFEYSKYCVDERDISDVKKQPWFLIDITEWPPKFVAKYNSEIGPSFDGRNYLNNYITRDHKPANILTVFPELFVGMLDDEIREYVLDFQLIQLPNTGSPDSIQHTYEIIVLTDRPQADVLPKLPICGHNINSVSGPLSFKIINTNRGVGTIDGCQIFSAVENEYRQTLKRFQVGKSLLTKSDLSLFIHPFGRIIYSQSGRDGLIELKYNRTKYKNIVQGYYIFVVLPINNDGMSSVVLPGFRLKIIGYYSTQVGITKKCQETGDDFVYSAKYYERERIDTVRLASFYSTYVRKIEQRVSATKLCLPDHLISVISRFYVVNRYLYDIRRINQQNNLVPLLSS